MQGQLIETPGSDEVREYTQLKVPTNSPATCAIPSSLLKSSSALRLVS